jgi:hypothetical protein
VIGTAHPALLKAGASDPPTSFYLVLAAAVLVQLGFTVWLGLQPGDAGPNRFGVRLGEKTSEQQADVFS